MLPLLPIVSNSIKDSILINVQMWPEGIGKMFMTSCSIDLLLSVPTAVFAVNADLKLTGL